MKKLFFASLLLLGLGLSVSAQSQDPKVIALINKASWCPVCQANGPRFEKDIMPMVMNNTSVKMVMNDLSTDQTKAASADMLEKAGVAKFAKKNTGTGMLYFLDAQSKKLISKISIAKTDEEIKQALQNALSKS